MWQSGLRRPIEKVSWGCISLFFVSSFFLRRRRVSTFGIRFFFTPGSWRAYLFHFQGFPELRIDADKFGHHAYHFERS